jgi:hypothetical protein
MGQHFTKTKGEATMGNAVIDVHDLPEKDVEAIERLVALLREKAKERFTVKETEETKLARWPLGVIGKITRKEIYDYL